LYSEEGGPVLIVSLKIGQKKMEASPGENIDIQSSRSECKGMRENQTNRMRIETKAVPERKKGGGKTVGGLSAAEQKGDLGRVETVGFGSLDKKKHVGWKYGKYNRSK